MANYYIVSEQALPPIIRKVADANRLLETGAAASVGKAVQMAGISRSAFYKYRAAVRPFNDMLSGRIVTFQALLHHQPGALSALLSFFGEAGANILTIHQILPSGGCAAVSVTAETSELTVSAEEFLQRVSDHAFVAHLEILGGCSFPYLTTVI